MAEHHLRGVEDVLEEQAVKLGQLLQQVEALQRQVGVAVELYELGDEEGCNRVLSAAGEGRIVEGGVGVN